MRLTNLVVEVDVLIAISFISSDFKAHTGLSPIIYDFISVSVQLVSNSIN